MEGEEIQQLQSEVFQPGEPLHLLLSPDCISQSVWMPRNLNYSLISQTVTFSFNSLQSKDAVKDLRPGAWLAHISLFKLLTLHALFRCPEL